MAANVELGVITRIALTNFVTYDEVVVKPGRNLNLIIGANGTGKSTIVSAIVLGLGGHPKVIGRATTVKEFVKAGQKQATIEIDLQHGPDNVVRIKREFNIENRTNWFVNDKPSNPKIVQDLMKEFNIQVDNLCQFLPQDRVQDFSNLSPQELLLETERSVGDAKLSEYHNQLKQLRQEQVALEGQLTTSGLLLQQEAQTCDLLKDKVGHIKEQKTIEKKLKTLKQKKAWVLYNEKREDWVQAKTERDEAEKTKVELGKKMKPIELEIAKLKASIKTLEVTLKQHTSTVSIAFNKLSKLRDDIEKSETSIEEAEKECQSKIKAELETDQRIAACMEQKNKLENDLQHKINEVGSVQAIEEQLASLTQTSSDHRNKITKLKTDQNFFVEKKLHCGRKIGVQQSRLQEVKSIESKRMEVLRRLSKDAYEGVMWLRGNKHLFSKPIFEPMILSINLKDASYAKYFENVISVRDLTAFVCEDKNDMNALLRHLRQQQKLIVNAVHSDPNKEVDDQPIIPIESLKQYGFQHYLLSLIDAPKTILNYLISNCRLHLIPIGNDKAVDNLDRLPDAIRFFFSPQKSYNIKYSSYSGAKSTTETYITARDNLSITVDSDAINQIEDEIARLEQEQNSYQLEIESYNEKIVVEERKANSTKEIKRKLDMDSTKIRDLQVKIRMNDNKLRDIQSTRKSTEEIRAEFKSIIEKLISEQLNSYNTYNQKLDDYYKSVIDCEAMKLQVKLQKNQLSMKENNSQEIREEYENAVRNLKHLDNEMRPLREEVEHLYKEARKMTNDICHNDKPNFKPYETAFAKLPATLKEILEEIHKTQAKAFNVNDQNEAQRITQRFETAKKNMEKCKHEINLKEKELLKVTEDITKIKDVWLPMLNALVEKINKNFSSCFNKMKCAGEVSLIDGGSPMDFAKYGLRIKVKFRDADELQALTRTHQSGGERTVTTAAYMISLQELTRVPFRCVDEINQGMDSTNERRVFELIVDITSMKNSSQYFLLTPKLLPDLKYHESMTVLTVFNGKYMAPCSKFDIHDNIDNICNVIKNRRGG